MPKFGGGFFWWGAEAKPGEDVEKWSSALCLPRGGFSIPTGAPGGSSRVWERSLSEPCTARCWSCPKKKGLSSAGDAGRAPTCDSTGRAWEGFALVPSSLWGLVGGGKGEPRLEQGKGSGWSLAGQRDGHREKPVGFGSGAGLPWGRWGQVGVRSGPPSSGCSRLGHSPGKSSSDNVETLPDAFHRKKRRENVHTFTSEGFNYFES